MTTTIKPEIGCYADGACYSEFEGNLKVIEVACRFGMEEPNIGESEEEDFDNVEEAAQTAESWLNDNVTMPYASWYWRDGDFGLWPVDPNDIDDDGDCIKCDGSAPSYLAVVSDHGNVTLYEVSLKEVWSLV